MGAYLDTSGVFFTRSAHEKATVLDTSKRDGEDPSHTVMRADDVVRSALEVPGTPDRLKALADRWETLARGLQQDDKLLVLALVAEMRVFSDVCFVASDDERGER